MRRRMAVSASLSRSEESLPNKVMTPRVGRNDNNKRRISVVLPAPEGPVRN